MATKDKRDIIKAETMVTLHFGNADLHLESKRAAIKAALLAATADIAATAANHTRIDTADGGTPPWGEVIIGPIWGERNPPRPEFLPDAAEQGFWKW